MNIALDDTLDEFEGQGHRSNVKVTNLKNVIFGLFNGLTCVECTDPFFHDILQHMTSRCDVCMSFDHFWAKILTRRARCGRACQRSGGFFFIFLSDFDGVSREGRSGAKGYPKCWNVIHSIINARTHNQCATARSRR